MPPLKRHPALQPLSREHHQILLMVWKLRQGLSFGVSPERIADYLKHFTQHYLQPHVVKEQTVLLPLLPANEEAGQAYRTAVAKINEHVEGVINRPTISGIEALANLVYDTVRLEERQLFPLAQQLLNADQMQTSDKNLNIEQLFCPVWIDEFWLK